MSDEHPPSPDAPDLPAAPYPEVGRADFAAIEEQVLAIEALSPHYQIELSRAGSLDKLTINVELDPINAASNNPDDVASSLTHRVKTFIGVTADVVLHNEGGVPRSQGKAQRMIDNR